MSRQSVGFIGLGNMGGPMAGHLAAAGHAPIVYDAAGTEGRAPPGARTAASAAEVAAGAETVFLSLPDGAVVDAVAGEILAANSAITRHVADTSTIGIPWARRLHEKLATRDIQYLDAPVSGGVAGARAGTVAVMYAGSAERLEALRPLFETFAANVFHVGEEPGQGQAMKLLNNFLSGTAMAATSEAVAFGEREGLDVATMLDVLNVSTGRNTATSDKFVNRVLTGTYDAGFICRQMHKDISLYREGVAAAASADPVSGDIAAIWRRFFDASPDADITRIYPFIKDDARQK